MSHELSERLLACERSNRRLKRLFFTQALLVGVFVLAVTIDHAIASRKPTTDTLQVKELVVVDPQGVPRVRIGGDVPDAVINGKVMPRGAKAAGVLLYDTTGQERGGYVTFDNGNAVLTLDSRQRQTALFVAGPDGGTALELWDREGSIGLRSDGNGSRITAVKGGQVVFQQPSIATIRPETCASYKEAASRLPAHEVAASCRTRFTEGACGACLGPGAE